MLWISHWHSTKVPLSRTTIRTSCLTSLLLATPLSQRRRASITLTSLSRLQVRIVGMVSSRLLQMHRASRTCWSTQSTSSFMIIRPLIWLSIRRIVARIQLLSIQGFKSILRWQIRSRALRSRSRQRRSFPMTPLKILSQLTYSLSIDLLSFSCRERTIKSTIWLLRLSPSMI